MVINRWQATYYLMTYLVIKGHKEAQEITLNQRHYDFEYLNPISHIGRWGFMEVIKWQKNLMTKK